LIALWSGVVKKLGVTDIMKILELCGKITNKRPERKLKMH
jgi:hypothetical protein